jgi:thioredoxin 1
MSESVIEVQDGGFAEAIRTGVVLVDFWAPRCGPCRMQGPILEEVAAAVGDKAVIVKVNIDENPKAADAFEFKSIPTLILLKDGEVMLQFTGLQGKETLLSAIGQVAGVHANGSKQ